MESVSTSTQELVETRDRAANVAYQLLDQSEGAEVAADAAAWAQAAESAIAVASMCERILLDRVRARERG